MAFRLKRSPQLLISLGLLILVAWFASEACSYGPTLPVRPPQPECRDSNGQPVPCSSPQPIP
jgi:hypothetical protein